MGRVRYEIKVDAPIEKVFGLVSRVVDFTKYSKAIREIEEVAPGTYRWRVKIFGISLGWEAKVVELSPPKRFAWASVSGVYNRGGYTLEKTPDGGTLVRFELEYRLTGVPVLDLFASPLVSAAMSLLYREVLENMRKTLAETH